MKFYAFLYVSWMIARTSAMLTSTPGLGLIYDTVKHIYASGDVKAVKILLQKSPEYQPYVYDVIMACPYITSARYQLKISDRKFYIKQIEELVFWKTCGLRTMPNVVETSTNAFYTFNIGYLIQKFYEMTNRKRIINFPSADQHSNVNPAIPILEVKADLATLHTTAIKQRFFVYEPDAIKDDVAQCKNYDLGLETLYEDPASVATFYTKKNQRKVLHKLLYPQINLQLPTATNKRDKVRNKLVDSTTDKHEYFVQHQLVPIDDFTDDASRLATCAFLNIVPVYEKISHGPLKRVEDYIRRIVQKLGVNTVQVETISHEILHIATKGPQEETIFEKISHAPWRKKIGSILKPIFWDRERSRIPAPRVILKILTYQVPLVDNIPNGKLQSPEPENSTQTEPIAGKVPTLIEYATYHIIIAIHNELKWKEGKICIPVEDQENKYGWQIPKTSVTELYTCTSNDPLLNGVLPPNVNGKPLDLRNVPVRINQSGRIQKYKNIFTDLQTVREETPPSSPDQAAESPSHRDQAAESPSHRDQAFESSHYPDEDTESSESSEYVSSEYQSAESGNDDNRKGTSKR